MLASENRSPIAYAVLFKRRAIFRRLIHLEAYEQYFLQEVSNYLCSELEVLTIRDVRVSASFDIHLFLRWMELNTAVPQSRLETIYEEHVSRRKGELHPNCFPSETPITESGNIDDYVDSYDYQQYTEFENEVKGYIYDIHANAEDLDVWSVPRDPGQM